ncbi:MAG: hypothetical protein ABIQ85_02485 [Cypionkella sp.]|jgi:hypothetical protein
MLKSILTPAFIALSLAGAASAATVSNDAQLAGEAGVAAGQYSAAELQNIINARRANDESVVNFYVSGTNRTQGTGDAAGQLAKTAGVAAGSYATSDLQLIINAQRENKPNDVAYILSGADRAKTADSSTAGKAQLAGALGVNAADYTLAQLVALDAARNSNDN